MTSLTKTCRQVGTRVSTSCTTDRVKLNKSALSDVDELVPNHFENFGAHTISALAL